MSFYLGIDLGTSYFKAGIYDTDGRQYGLGREAVPKVISGNRCELPIEQFWNAIGKSIRLALADARISPAEVTALSYSSQANSFVLLDKSGCPLTPLILWPDRRAGDDCEPQKRLSTRSDFLEKTGIGVTPDGEWMLAKLDWFQKNEPHTWSRTAFVMSISDYLVYSLTGLAAGDTSTASMSCLLDVGKGKWWPEALDIMNIRKDMLSKPLPAGTKVGTLTEQGAEKTGLSASIVLYLGCLDHHAVAIGAGILKGRRISESTGTVLAAVGYREGYAPRKGIITSPGPDNGSFFCLAFDSNGATAVEWYQKNYAPKKTISQLEKEACQIPAGCDGLTALPRSDTYPGLEGFRNVRPEHTPAHFLRAIFESTAKSLVQLIDALDPDRQVTEMIPSGGGARNPLWLQIKADMLNRAYIPQPTGELATKGAAMICHDKQEIKQQTQI